MFLPSEDLETTDVTEIPNLNGMNPRENAILDLRKICDGLFKDFGSIRMGMALHTLVVNQRDACLKLGVLVQAANDVINDYRRQS